MTPLADSVSSSTRFCAGCTRDLPLDQFPFRVIGESARRGKCRSCQAGYMRTYRACRRAKSLDQLTSALAREPNLSKVEATVAVRLRQFGGLDAFLRQWKAQFDAAVQQAPGSRRVLNVFAAIVRMIEAADASRPDKDLSLLSDEDLARERDEALVALIAKHPALAVWAARKLGLSVD